MNLTTGEIDGTPFRRSVRNEPMLLVEIETDRVGTFGICENAVEAPYPKGGARLKHKQRICIYEHEWPQVQAMVRTDAHEAMLADAMASAPQQVPDGDVVSLGAKLREAEAKMRSAKPGSAAQSRAESEVAEAELEIARAAIRLLCLKPGMQDGIPPLTSARVIRSAPPPPTPQNLAVNAMSSANAELAAVLKQFLAERDASPKGKRSAQD